MPFGRVFGALFFGIVCAAGALRAGGATGLAAAALCVALAVALLTRRAWARWAGVAGAAAVTVVAGARMGDAPTPLELLVLFAAPLTAALLVWPATGRRADATPARARDPLAWASAGALAVLLAAAFLGGALPYAGRAAGEAAPLAAPSPSPSSRGAVQAASDVARTPDAQPAPDPRGEEPAQVEWTDFASGIERAKEEDRPMLVHFTAAWCGYCRKMDRETWTHPTVIREASTWIPVRVDIDSRQDLAGRYGIRGTPSQLVVAPSGRVLARAGGYQTPRELLDWLEEAEARVSGASAARDPIRGLAAGGR